MPTCFNLSNGDLRTVGLQIVAVGPDISFGHPSLTGFDPIQPLSLLESRRSTFRFTRRRSGRVEPVVSAHLCSWQFQLSRLPRIALGFV